MVPTSNIQILFEQDADPQAAASQDKDACSVLRISVDVEGSSHANLKKTQYVNQIMDVCNSEIKNVVRFS